MLEVSDFVLLGVQIWGQRKSEVRNTKVYVTCTGVENQKEVSI